jgi:aspartate aminotransferase-like enzyme
VLLKESHMKYRLLTPGPTPVPDETLLELARPVFYHRSPEFKQLFAEVQEDLQYVFCTRHPVVTLAASGTGGMEAALVGVVPAAGKVICLIAGRWGERWRNLCKAFGFEAVCVTVSYGKAIDPSQLASALAEHPDAAAVCCTLCETATGVAGDVQAFGKLVAPTRAVLLVDAISGLGTMECRTDDWHVDLCVTGSQKALMMPPGLAFVSVSPKGQQALERNASARVFYFDLRKYLAKLKENDTPWTPANTLIRAQRVSLKRLRAEGNENVWARHARMAEAARAGMQALGLELFAEKPAPGLTVAHVPAGLDGSELLKKLEKQYGLKYAGGQDTLKGKIIRLAHMGHADPFDVLAALAGLEMVLLEMGRPVTPGAAVAAAQRVFARAVRTPQPATV